MQITSMDDKINELRERDEKVIDENANKDSWTFACQRDLLSGVVARDYSIRNIIPEHLAQAHASGMIHMHDLDYSPFFPMFNCMLIDFKGMFEKGFTIGNADVESPKSITTAVALISQIVANVSSNIYGGTSFHRADEILAPYAEMSYKKHLKDAKEWVEGEEKQKAFAKKKTEKEIYDAMQSLEYELNTLYNSNGQTPFFTFNFGLGTSWFAREIQKSILKVRMEGLGKDKKTSVFPKLVFTLKRGLNLEKNDQNYDIKKLALECSAKRIYPDILSYDRIVKLLGYFDSPMGCIDGKELVTYKWMGNTYVEGIKRMYQRLFPFFEEKTNSMTKYLDLIGVDIYDSHSNGFVKCYRILKNPDKNNWTLIKFNNGRSLLATSDHPLPTQRGRIYVSDLQKGDLIPANYKQYTDAFYNADLDKAWLDGLMICDGCYQSGTLRISLGMDEKDIVDKVQDVLINKYGIETKVIKQERGIKGFYYDVVSVGKVAPFIKQLKQKFGAIQKIDRSIPQYVFSSNFESRLAFMAGLIDADGHTKVVHNGARLEIGSTNKELALQEMVLLQSLNIPAKLYLNHYTKKNNNYRYKIEAYITKQLSNAFVCEKKKQVFSKYNCKETEVKFGKNVSVVSIDNIGFRNCDSYDVTTESDRFDVSGINSHNCRSFLPYYEEEEGKPLTYGRRNMGVVTLNIPRIAIESKGDKREFWDIFDKRMKLMKDALLFRVNTLKQAKAKNAPILYQYGATGHRLSADSEVFDMFKNGEASISIGYIGLYEAATVFYGAAWENNHNAKEFTLDIMRRIYEYKEKWCKETGYGFSIYGTPSESLTDRFCRLDTKKFGIIKDITDKGYYTNSFHYDVRKSVDPFTKFKFESEYEPYTTGGFIHYCEAPSLKNNLSALEKIWDYAYDESGFYGVNQPVDECFECGFKGEFDSSVEGFKCPKCGNHNPETASCIRRLCGYLSSVIQRKPIRGRIKEISSRVKNYQIKGDDND